MNTKRLLKLAKFLDKLPPNRFDNQNWWTGTKPKHEDDYDYFTINDKGKACAGGWACTIPEFMKAGLGVNGPQFTNDVSAPIFEGKIGFEALAEFFDIDVEHIRCIFSEYAYTKAPKPKDVAARIRAFIEVDKASTKRLKKYEKSV